MKLSNITLLFLCMWLNLYREFLEEDVSPHHLTEVHRHIHKLFTCCSSIPLKFLKIAYERIQSLEVYMTFYSSATLWKHLSDAGDLSKSFRLPFNLIDVYEK